MNLEHNLSFLFMLTTCILFEIPGYLCQNQQYTTCRQPFQCGNIRNLSYPFYGGSRPASCGHPGFELNCQSAAPLLNISSILYRVLEINNNAQTLRVARDDLWDTTCPQFLYNTTLDSQIFNLTDAQSLRLYYNCPNDNMTNYVNRFGCSVNGTRSSSFYFIGQIQLPGGYVCNDNIFVPVNQSAATALSNPATTSLDVFRDALTSGFSIQWWADNGDCEDCVGSGGVCGYDWNTISFACYCDPRRQPYSLVCIDSIRTRNGGLSTRQKITILVSVLGCAIIPFIIIIYYFSKKCMSDKESNKNIAKFMREYGSLAPKRFSYNEIKKMTNSFADKLGQGGFGCVYKGTMPEGGFVAVKVLTGTKTSGEEFINEVASISKTSHVNIVNLLGFCYGKSKRALVYEFMPNKSLDKFLHQNVSTDTDFQLEWNKLYDIAVGVARGLEYLHRGCNARIVHFDIKPQNILLDEEFHPKISDFGLAKLYRKQQSILTSVFGARGTIGYIAPEVFCRNVGAVSHKSDVYSYGMMILEMAGAREIEESPISVEPSENYFPDRIYEQGIVRKLEIFDEKMNNEEVETVRKMFLIGFWCIQTVPSNRPSMSNIVEMFEGSVESIPIPPKPFFSSPRGSQRLNSQSFGVDLSTETLSEFL